MASAAAYQSHYRRCNRLSSLSGDLVDAALFGRLLAGGHCRAINQTALAGDGCIRGRALPRIEQTNEVGSNEGCGELAGDASGKDGSVIKIRASRNTRDSSFPRKREPTKIKVLDSRLRGMTGFSSFPLIIEYCFSIQYQLSLLGNLKVKNTDLFDVSHYRKYPKQPLISSIGC